MPRPSTSKKAHSNHRHENGLVGPGKRITKQKSNGQLNGAPRGAPPDTPPQSPVLGANPLLNNAGGNPSSSSLSDPSKDSATLLRPAGVNKRASDSSLDAAELQHNGLAQSAATDNVTKPRSDTVTSKRTSTDVSPLQLASTILRSCPLYDTIAILILLLQLPPLVLTLVQALFASLTFVPPTGLSLGSVFSLFDVFQGSAGAPSLWTMIAVDALYLGGWYCLWTWARNFALDLAQVQIAITLGGANSAKTGGVNTFCVAIVLVLHLFRSRGVRHFLFDYILSTKVFSDHQIAQVAQFFPRDFGVGSSFAWSPSSIRSLFAIHIIAQASIAMVRRWLHAYRDAPLSKPSKRADTEAAAGAGAQDSSALESTPPSGSAPGVELAPVSPPTLRDGKERVLSMKKRRRQANQVRSRQPFWAALASTKVTVMREYEHSKVSTPSAPQPNGEVTEFTTPEDNVVWISGISPSTIKFEASDADFDTDSQDDEDNGTSKPFYVRINGAYWTATTIYPVDDEGQSDGGAAQWKGEIAGLAPHCTYTCTFVRSRDNEEFCVVTVKTPALPDADQSSLLSSPPARQMLRPSSPVTTLKNSIATAEAKLAEARNRLTRSRRAHKAAVSKLEKEVDSLNSRLKTNSDDTRQRQKLLQVERSMRQTEDATQSIEAALEGLAMVPGEELEEWTKMKEEFEAQNTLLNQANDTLNTARETAKSEVSSVNDEYKTLAARRERLVARQTRLTEQHDRITQANVQGLNEKERRAAEQSAKDVEHSRVETSYLNQYAILNREIQSLQSRTSQAWQEVQAFETAAQQALRNSNGPLTPEGPLPGTQQTQLSSNAQFGNRSGFAYPNTFVSTAFPPVSISPDLQHSSPFLAFAKPHNIPSDSYGMFGKNGSIYNAYQSRPRSPSNPSTGNNSSFGADFEDADPIPPMPGNNADFSEIVSGSRRKGSGSSRSGNSGSPVTNVMAGLGSPLRAGRGSPGQSIW
ncbi:putative ubiquitination network signaling [Phaeomoniella chlamydospora]|uniref:Putative ubiquitination network signaling n=1 Tax=Phaeomoniella chlamydospora TaxID=158046 RepID=A0A0G2G990_PHACM|nr:putative ubiquitination network signaling [Phaeomoniella chlamydospora]